MSDYRRADHLDAVDALTGLQRALYFVEVGTRYGVDGLMPENFVEQVTAMTVKERNRAGRITDISFLTAKEGGQWINVHSTADGFLEVSVREDDSE